MPLTRRGFCAAALGTAAGGALSACGFLDGGPDEKRSRLTARPAAPTGSVAAGRTTIGADPRDGLLFVPVSFDPAVPVPLVVAFHGAGGVDDGPINLLSSHAETDGFIVLATDSRGRTWDAILGAYRADVAVIDRSLRYVFDNCAVDPDRIFVEGFSDGASYALGLGLANGDLFKRIVAFSSGFIPGGGARVGRPRVFMSHGAADPILPIDSTSRTIVPALRRDGYDVTYREFDGGHEVPETILDAALAWMLGG